MPGRPRDRLGAHRTFIERPATPALALGRPCSKIPATIRMLVLATLVTSVSAGCATSKTPDPDAAVSDQYETTKETTDETTNDTDEYTATDPDANASTGQTARSADPGPEPEPAAEPEPEPAPVPRLDHGVSEITVEQVVDGITVQRRALVALPSPNVHDDGRGDITALPILVALHGNGGRPEGMLRDLRRFVDDGRFAALVPEGIARSWNLGREASTADDVAFLDLLLDRLQHTELDDGRRELDLDRVYAFGYSNGAGLVHQLLARSDRYHAVAAAASGLTHDLLPDGPVHPTSLLSLHGTDDPVVPYDGGIGVAGHDFLPVEDSAALWADRFDCPDEPAIGDTPDGNRRLLWEPCQGGHRIVHYRVEGADHGLPPDLEGGLFDLVVEFFEIAGRSAD